MADITYIRLEEEFVYLAVILDAFNDFGCEFVAWAADFSMAFMLSSPSVTCPLPQPLVRCLSHAQMLSASFRL